MHPNYFKTLQQSNVQRDNRNENNGDFKKGIQVNVAWCGVEDEY